MSEIEKINHVFEYNDRMGVETLNPLVSVVDWSQCQPMCSSRCSYGFYAVFLKDVKCGDITVASITIIRRGHLFFWHRGKSMVSKVTV